jgi:Lipocalin-like domain
MEGTSGGKQLVGTWKLVSIQFEFDDTKERVDMYGPNPLGYLVLTDNSRIMALVTASGRTSPSEDADSARLFKSMMSYAGKYRIDGDRFVTTIDVAWHPGWMGTVQTRSFRIEGDRFSITTDVQTHPMFEARRGKGVIIWTRE